jgi:ATP-dependent exoDNAse (exonuclease V) beta subunit
VSARTSTPEQAAAIGASGRDVLVEAGAGSGKTGVMVDRYCRLVCDEGVQSDAVLAFTFTDKAAAELRHRIRTELARRALEGSERARQLLGEIGGAWVTTIHGFCNRLLATYPVAAGIDPRFRILDGPEAHRVARDAFEEALETFLGSGDRDQEQTVAAFGITGMRGVVIGMHAELRSRGMVTPRLPEAPAVDLLGALRHAADVAAATVDELKPLSGNRVLVERALEVLGGGKRIPSLDELATVRTDRTARSIADFREAIDVAVACAAEAGEGGEAYGHIAELLRLFGERYEQAKQRRAAVDFEDLQLMATQLLERDEIASAYRGRFSHLMVDEFQDTNRVQLRLIEALRGPGTKLMVVGDELQSIYGFRHADLEVFREQRRAIEASAEAEAIALSGNFRSRPEVIGAINAIGEKLLGGAFVPLRVGGVPESSAAGDGPLVELLLTARDGWDGEGVELEPATDAATPINHVAEARFVAARLRELADTGVPPSEMAVLLRAFSHLDAYEDSLERAGLRPYVVGGRGYWSQQQVADVCALLATIANPLDDLALLSALSSPACGVTPDTLWLLRAATGRDRPIWPAVDGAARRPGPELKAPGRLNQITKTDRELLSRFVETLDGLRRRASRLPLADLIDAAVTETGYDLAVLMRSAGEARMANVRKLMSLAAEFDLREGRDLRGLLEFLESRADVDSEGQAATAAEGHDGVRIMTVHNAKGLEFGVVAVPDLARGTLSGSRVPLLTIGHEAGTPRIGMQLRRLGAASLNIYSHRELREEAQQREGEEELRLFHVAATRARDRLILSGVIKPEPGKEAKPGTPVIERIVDAFAVPRDRDSSIDVPPPEPRKGLAATFEPSTIAVRLNLPSEEQAASLRTRRDDLARALDLGRGPAPLARPPRRAVPNRPLSYTALAAYERCGYRFYMERVLGLGSMGREGEGGADADAAREEQAARGRAVHTLLEWSQANRWHEPPAELVRLHAMGAGLEPGEERLAEVLGLVRGWLASDLLRERVSSSASLRAEVPIMIAVGSAVLRGSIDLLAERDGVAPLVVDYKTSRLGDSSPAELASHYETQRDIYALAVAKARGAPAVDIAYVFLERPEEPVVTTLSATELEAAQKRLEATIAQIGDGEFSPAAVEARGAQLCLDCPALQRTCSGPAQVAPNRAATAVTGG